MESLWLVAAFTVPLAIAPSDWMLSYVQMPKVTLLRSLVSLMAILWAVEYALSARVKSATTRQAHDESRQVFSLRAFKAWASQEPSRWVVVAATAFMAVYLLCTLLSTSPRISIWGRSPGEDGYGLYNMLTYYVLFLVVATHLKTKPQLWRLLATIACAGAASSLLGVLERLDLVGLGNGRRVESTFGNPLFFATYLVLTIPISLALWLSAAHSSRRKAGLGLWGFIIVLQLFAIGLTLSRGPWIALAAGLVGFLALGAITLDRRAVLTAGVAVGLSLAMAAVALRALPPRISDRVLSVREISPEERLLSVSSEVAAGGFGTRTWIWKASGELFTDRPWFPFDVGAGFKPAPTLPFLRHAIGYGPELYSYVYPLTAFPITGLQLEAHNHFIHEAVELGYLGLLSYIALLASAFVPGLALLISRRKAYSWEHKLALIALLAALGGCVIEQMVGIARVGDMALSWTLLAVLVALPAAMRAEQERAEAGNAPGGRRATLPALKIGFVAIVVITMGALVWTKNLSYVLADVSAARAYATSDLAEALALADSAIGLAPDAPAYYQARADILSGARGLDEDIKAEIAERIYADRFLAFQANPLSARARLRLANAAFSLARLGYPGKGEEAIRIYQELIGATPKLLHLHPNLYNLIAIAYIDVGRPQDGLRTVDKLLSMDLKASQRAKALYLKGVAYNELGMPSEAAAALERSLELGGEPQVEAEAQALLAKLHGELGESARP
jgi:tetratricopeptide (TPR) repeat protein